MLPVLSVCLSAFALAWFVLLGVSSDVVVVVAVVFVHRPCGKRRIRRSDEDNEHAQNP